MRDLQNGSFPVASPVFSSHSHVPQYAITTTPQYASPVGNRETSRHPLPASNLEAGDHSQTPHSANTGRDTFGASTTYIGRSHYLTEETSIDEDSSRAYPSYHPSELSGVGESVLHMFKAFDLPARSIRQGLVDNFIQFCYPWTPILSRGELNFSSPDQPSLLLSQALFLAASRASSSPGILAFATPEQLYQRAKGLFYMNYETDPLAVIKATIMLQWYTPDGPEHVSYDTGEFWLKVGVGIAYQIGLHKDPGEERNASIRRRVWWSLVVRQSADSVVSKY